MVYTALCMSLDISSIGCCSFVGGGVGSWLVCSMAGAMGGPAGSLAHDWCAVWLVLWVACGVFGLDWCAVCCSTEVFLQVKLAIIRIVHMGPAPSCLM
jgi:hypothetical protein